MTIPGPFRRTAKELACLALRPRPILFDHVPKTAGTAVTNFLMKNYPARLTFTTNSRNPQSSVDQFKSLPAGKRRRYLLVAGHSVHQLLDYVRPDSVRFTIFREPIDRIISHYYFVRQDEDNYLHARILKSNMSLEEYALAGLSGELSNHYTTHFSGLSSEEIRVRGTEAVERAASAILGNYDVIGFQDDLPGAIRKLSKAARLYRRFDNRITNQSVGRPRADEVSERARSAITEANPLDIRLYALLRRKLGSA